MPSTLPNMNLMSRVATLAAAAATVLAAAFTAAATTADPEPDSHVNITGNALDPTFRPLPGQLDLGERTFLNEVREEYPRIGGDEMLLSVRVGICTQLDGGYPLETITGYWSRNGYSKPEAEVLTVASAGTCADWSALDALQNGATA